MWSEELLMNKWISMFDVGEALENTNEDLQGFALLIAAMKCQYRKMLKSYEESERSKQILRDELADKSAQCAALQERLDRAPKPCETCNQWGKTLEEERRRADDAEARMESIAQILKVGKLCKENSKNFDILTQMLLGDPKPEENEEEATPEEEIIDEAETETEIFSTPQRRKKISNSVNLPILNSKKTPVRRNLTSEFNNETCVKNLAVVCGVVGETPVSHVWHLKGKHGTGEEVKGKLMKQTKLSLISTKKAEVLTDITSLKGFNGGVPSSSKENDVDFDDSIICSEGFNTTDFKPAAASTQLVNHHDSSFDRVPVKTSPTSPQRKRLKKEEKAKLPAWECLDCQKYYKGQNLSPNSLRRKIDACSRHRGKSRKPQLDKTPPYFWEPNFPSSEQCAKFHTSIRAKSLHKIPMNGKDRDSPDH